MFNKNDFVRCKSDFRIYGTIVNIIGNFCVIFNKKKNEYNLVPDYDLIKIIDEHLDNPNWLKSMILTLSNVLNIIGDEFGISRE